MTVCLNYFSRNFDLALPNIKLFLPHTFQNPDSFVPAFKISKNRTGVKIVFGIPTVKRDHAVRDLWPIL